MTSYLRASIEFRWLTDLCLGQYGGATWRPTDNLVDWGKLLALSERHRVTSLLAAKVGSNASIAPSESRQTLRQAWRSSSLEYLKQIAETTIVVSALAEKSVSTLVLKGAAAAGMYYANEPELKASRDVDLLLRSEQLDAANAVMLSLGYRRTMPTFEIAASGESMLRILLNAYEYVNPETGQIFELHYRLLHDPYVMAIPFEELDKRAKVVPVSGATLRTLSEIDMALLVCCHAASHGFARLKWVADVSRALLAVGAGGERTLLEAASQCGCSRHLALAYLFLEQLGGKPAPSSIERDRRIRRLVRLSIDLMMQPERVGRFTLRDVRSDIQQLRLELGLAERSRSKWFFLLQHLANQDDVRLLQLGKVWAPLYAVVGRPLALWRFASRSLAIRAKS